MHYHYFTIEQRNALEQLIRSRLESLGGDKERARELESALKRVHSPEFGVCEICSGDIPYSRLAEDPSLRRCPQHLA